MTRLKSRIEKFMNFFVYRHDSIGQKGKLISVPKIRTMRGAVSKNRDAKISISGKLDPTDSKRVTELGRILRPLGLDECLQAWNVFIKRDMQILGIRPFVVDEFNVLPNNLQELMKQEKPGWIPADARYDYVVGDYNSRIAAMKRYFADNPQGAKRAVFATAALFKRWIKYSQR